MNEVLLVTAAWAFWLATVESAPSIGTVIITNAATIIVSITGLVIAYSNLKEKIDAGRKRAESEHRATIAKVEAGN